MVERFDVALKYPCGRDPYAVMVSVHDGSYVMAAHYDAARAEIERLTKERISLIQAAKDVGASFRKALVRAEKAEAERDEAVAAAYEAAADALQNVADNWDCGHNESRLCDCARDAEQWGFAADDVRSLTPADAQSGLEAYGREKVREGMQRAADIAAFHDIYDDTPAHSVRDGIEAEILAKMETLK